MRLKVEILENMENIKIPHSPKSPLWVYIRKYATQPTPTTAAKKSIIMQVCAHGLAKRRRKKHVF